MKKVLFAVALAATILPTGAGWAKGKKSQVTVSYNKVQDITIVNTVQVKLKKKLAYNAGYNYPGQTPSRPRRVGFEFAAARVVSGDDNLEWKNVETVYFRHGDTKLSCRVTNYETRQNKDPLVKGLLGTVFVEYLTCSMPVDEFEALSRDKSVLFQVGDTEGEIKEGEFAPLAELGTTIPQE